MPAAILKQRKVLAFAEEATAGTPVPFNASSGMFCFDPVAQSNISMDEREATGTLDMLPAVPGAYGGKLSFETEYVGGGSGSPAPAWAKLLACCGMVANGNTYTPTSDPTLYNTATLGVYNTGTLKTLYGAMGTFSISGESGKRVKFKFDFTGIWAGPTDVAMPAPVFPALEPPRFAAAAFGVTPAGGAAFAPAISKFSFEAGNTVTLVPNINTTSGYAFALVTKRKYGGSIDPLATLAGTFDWWGKLMAPTLSAMTLTVGTVAGNTMTIAAPSFQVMDPQEANRNDLTTTDVKYALTAGTTPDTSLSITFA